jgi:hypothetical protein
MRTTLTLDEDVSRLLERLMKKKGLSLKAAVNEGLRQGLRVIEEEKPQRRRSFTRPADLGTCLIGNLDDVAEALSIAEGDSFR